MPVKAKWFLLGALSSFVLLCTVEWVFDNLKTAALRSKWKHVLGETRLVNSAVLEYRSDHGSFPVALTAAEMYRQLPLPGSMKPECDYFSNGKTFTLVCPSFEGPLRWEPYVVHDGQLIAWPYYMTETFRKSFQQPSTRVMDRARALLESKKAHVSERSRLHVHERPDLALQRTWCRVGCQVGYQSACGTPPLSFER